MSKMFRQSLVMIIVFLTINFLYRTDFLEFRSGFVFDILSPISFFFEKPKRIALNEEVTIRMLRQDKIILQNQIKQLKNELQLRENYVNSFIEAKVINFSLSEIKINKGKVHGIFLNQKVTIGNYLIGKVILVEKYRSLVGLLDNVFVSNFCFVQSGDDMVWGILAGGSDKTVRITKISQEKRIRVNDFVYCENYLAGKIKKINMVSSDLFYEAIISPFIDVENFDTVYVEEAHD